MKKLSTGDDSTLGSYRRLCTLFFGKDSPATKFIEDKIAEHEKGEDEEVVTDESQVVMLLTELHHEGEQSSQQ